MYAFAILFSLISCLKGATTLNLSVDGENGHNSQSCLSGSEACETLQYIAREGHTASNLTINIISPELELNSSANFSFINGISIIGSGNKTVIRCSGSWYHAKMVKGHSGEGIIISNSSNILLQYIVVTNCGLRFDHFPHVLQAIGIYSSRNVSVNHVVFAKNSGYGLVLLNTNGHICINSSSFETNGLHHDNGNRFWCSVGVGGLLITHQLFKALLNNSGAYIVTETNFTDNTNIINSSVCMRKDLYLKKGGGLRIDLHINGNFTISKCSFIKNSAVYGAGIYILGLHNATNNTIHISESLFCDNDSHEGGGGIDIRLTSSGTSLTDTPQFFIESCNFTRNHATYGGALSLFSNAEANNINVTNCRFTENDANGGAAVNLNRYRFPLRKSIRVSFDNCHFLANKAGRQMEYHDATMQRGSFFTREIDVIFTGITHFANNVETALYCASASIEFTNGSVTRFIRNTGGAMLLVDDAQLSLDDRVEIQFINNTAPYGAAICVIPLQAYFQYFTDTCFIRQRHNGSTGISFKFLSNNASTGMANDVFISTLRPCIHCDQNCGSHFKKLFLNSVFNFTESLLNNSKSVATAAENMYVSQNLLYVYPGLPYPLHVKLYDELQNLIIPLSPLSANLKLSNHRSSSMKLILSSSSSVLTNNTITVIGDLGATDTVMLKVTSLSSVHMTADIELVRCPAGYYYDSDRKQCNCSGPNRGFIGITHCQEAQDHPATITVGYWAGYRSDGNFYTGICAAELCQYPNQLASNGYLTLVLTNNETVLEKHVCAGYRRGTLCGECIEGYSTLYHSPAYRCHKCSNVALAYGILLYIVSELLPVTVIFLAILMFDIRLTSGAFYTFIFYAQFLNGLYIDAYKTIPLDGLLGTIAFVYKNLYGLFNFDILNAESLSFCLWPKATVLHLFMVQYMTTIYALLLIIFTMALLKVNSLYTCIKLCYQLGKRDIRGSIINALSAFLVLCYSQCVQITFSILIKTQLNSEDDSQSTYVTLFNGELKYMKGGHLYFAIPAILCLFIVILPPPLILLAEPLLIKVSNMLPRGAAYWMLQVRMRLKPFLDSFQSCFKDNCRIVAGLFFCYRISLFFPYVFSVSVAAQYMLDESILFLILLFHCMAQPFQKKWHNQLDNFLLLNLLAVNTLTIIRYFSINWNVSQMIHTYVLIQLLLMTLPLVYICGYMGYFALPCIFKARIKPIQLLYRLHHSRANTKEYMDIEESLPDRLLSENMLSLSYNSTDN